MLWCLRRNQHQETMSVMHATIKTQRPHLRTFYDAHASSPTSHRSFNNDRVATSTFGLNKFPRFCDINNRIVGTWSDWNSHFNGKASCFGLITKGVQVFYCWANKGNLWVCRIYLECSALSGKNINETPYKRKKYKQP